MIPLLFAFMDTVDDALSLERSERDADQVLLVFACEVIRITGSQPLRRRAVPGCDKARVRRRLRARGEVEAAAADAQDLWR